MNIQERWYQEEAVEALFVSIESGEDCHPLVVAPTGTGKTHIISKFVDRYLNKYPLSNILVLCDESNVLQQDYDTLCEYFSDAIVGLYSASLFSREKSKITVAGIQSVYRRADEFSDCNIIIIDEAHAIGMKETGMYKKFLRKIKANYIGLTATPFRTGSGYIHEGKGALFNKLAYDMSEPKIFKRLQDEGYLSKIYSQATFKVLDADKEGVGTQSGDYKLDDLSDKFDREEITKDCCDEIIKFAKEANRKKWLIFAIDIKHADHIRDYLVSEGIKAESVHSEKSDKNQIVKDYKNDKYQALVNVNILVKGFDEPRIDLIATLRPTKSPVIHVQSIGRGLRVVYADGYDISTAEARLKAIEAGPKQECVVLDFPGNTDRLGPIDNVTIKKKGDKKGKGNLIKICPECRTKNHLSVRHCIKCGFEFQFKTNLNIFASEANVTTTVINDRDDLIFKKWIDVKDVKYVPVHFQGKLNSVKIIYVTEEMDFVEKVKPGEKRYDGRVAEYWIKRRLDSNTILIPKSAEALWSLKDSLKKPNSIFVDVHLKYKNVMDYRFD